MQPQIIFEDDTTIVVDKPWGMVVNRSDSTTKGTLQDWAEEQIKGVALDSSNDPTLDAEFGSRGGIVHRLDKDTSGVIVIAKSAKSFGFLKEQFQSRTTHKVYLTLVHGVVEPKVGTINAPIERNPFNRLQYGVFPGGKEAQTSYSVTETFTHENEKYSLVEVTPKSGRTHQIRVHMKYLGHSVVSDPIYAGRKQYQKDTLLCPRLFLHAAKLTLTLPSGVGKTFQAPLPTELYKVVELLKKGN